MKVEFEEIDKEDHVLIRTQNSEYNFKVLDPEERRGVLSGGTLGEKTRDAILVGAVPTNFKQETSDSLAVQTGARALFFITAKTGVERLITSVVTDIKHFRNKERMRLA
ncbi:MAG TPA: hypothetical protein VLD57_06815 [Blastocatellia bacterium]|nr:hypothetical protein [Blastocatellia bacterium]